MQFSSLVFLEATSTLRCHFWMLTDACFVFFSPTEPRSNSSTTYPWKKYSEIHSNLVSGNKSSSQEGVSLFVLLKRNPW